MISVIAILEQGHLSSFILKNLEANEYFYACGPDFTQLGPISDLEVSKALLEKGYATLDKKVECKTDTVQACLKALAEQTI